MERHEEISRSIIKKFRKDIWCRFIKAIERYDLIQPNDKIGVCISGGKDSFLLAMCMRELSRHWVVPFEVVFLSMDPGYNEANRAQILKNAELMKLDVNFFQSDIFDVVDTVGGSPCYLCARMRRGYLYKAARDAGCNKIALGHHFNDVVETILMSMTYGAEYKTMMPKLRATNFVGMELIRPLYMVKEQAIIDWAKYNELEFIRCACRFTAESEHNEENSKRLETKRLIAKLKETNPHVDDNIVTSSHNVGLDTVIGYRTKGKRVSFLDTYYDDSELSEE